MTETHSNVFACCGTFLESATNSDVSDQRWICSTLFADIGTHVEKINLIVVFVTKLLTRVR